MEIIYSSELINLLLVLAAAAAVAGFMAGLLGVGGGIIMVPALYYAFTVLDFDIATRMHLSVGTSLAIIIPTSIISTKTHMEYDAVDFRMVRSFGIFILLGVIAGTFLAVSLKTPALVLFFSIFAFMVGLFFIFVREKLMDNPKKISDLVKNISGVIIGFISIPLGIGGGSLMVPFMRTFGYDIRKKFLYFFKKKINFVNRLTDPTLGGGAINDLGCYGVAFSNKIASFLNCSKNYEIKKKVLIGPTGVDINSKININYSNNFHSTIHVAFDKNFGNSAEIVGSKGSLYIPSLITPSNNYNLILKTNVSKRT